MSGLYKVRGSDPADLVVESNRIFELISDRLDKIEGYRGEPKVWNREVHTDDIIIEVTGKGVVLKDFGNPSRYWRIGITASGTMTQTLLGREYK